MFSYLKRRRLEIEDWLRYQPTVRRLIGRWNLWRTRGQDVRAVASLCAAARLAGDDVLERHIQERITRLITQLDVSRIDWAEFVPDFHDRSIDKAAILKPNLGPREKGVIYIAFENQWIKLLTASNLREFAERYTLVIAPSSSPHNLINYVFAHVYPDPIFTQISNAQDAEVLPGVSPRFVVLPLQAAHWINPSLYQPLPQPERSIDLLMVASWGKVKRHQALFAALRSMPRELRVTLVGQDQEGRTAETTLELARWYGVADRVTILSNQPHAEVRRLLCQARATTVLSKREGSCVAVAESMFADAPVALLADAVIGARAFINDQTGRFLDERRLAHDLTEFVQNTDRYRPREWAERNISCLQSTRTLNDIVKRHALERGETWTEDIAALEWAPTPELVHAEDRRRLAPERADIARRFGLEIGSPLLE